MVGVADLTIDRFVVIHRLPELAAAAKIGHDHIPGVRVVDRSGKIRAGSTHVVDKELCARHVGSPVTATSGVERPLALKVVARVASRFHNIAPASPEFIGLSIQAHWPDCSGEFVPAALGARSK